MIRTSLSTAWGHRRRLASTTFAIVLGIAFLSGTLIIRDSATAGFASAFTSANAGTDAVVRNAVDLTADDEPRAPIDATLVDRIAAIDGVAATAAEVTGLARLMDADGDPIGDEHVPTFATNWIDEPALAAYRLAEGRAPVAGGEIVIDARSAREGGLEVGSATTVLVPEPVEATVVGIARFGNVESLGSSSLVAFTLPETRRLLLEGQPMVSAIRVSAREGVSPEELVRRLDLALPAEVETITGTALTAEQEADIQSDFLGFFTAALLGFAGIALLVAVFSIFNTFTVLAAQRRRESALLRAIGASRRQVLGAGLIEAVAVAIVGTVLGIAGGVAIGHGLRSVVGADGLGMPVDDLVVSATTIGSAGITGLVVTVSAGLLPAVRAARIPPIAALRDAAAEHPGGSRGRAASGVLLLTAGAVALLVASGGSSALALTGLGALCLLGALGALGPFAAPWAARMAGVVLRRRGVAGDLAARNAARNPRRTAGTAAALLVGVSVVSLFTVLGASIKASIESSVQRGFAGDLMIVASGGPGLDPAIADRVDDVAGVDTVASLSFPTVELAGTPTRVTATDLGALARVADIDLGSGDVEAPAPDEFAAAEAVAAERGWQVGDRITASFADGASASLRLGATYRDRALLGDVVVPAAVVEGPSTAPQVQVVALGFAPDADGAATRQEVTAVAAGPGNAEIMNGEEFAADQSGQVDVLLTIVYGLLAVAIGIAGMGIANTLALSIHERTRELGLLRAVGGSRRQFRAMVRWESVIVAMFGVVGGIGLGVFCGWAMIRALHVSEGIGTFALPVLPLAVIVVLGAGLGVLAAVRPARRAARLDVLAAIGID